MPAITHITYPDLYDRWEHGQWSANDIDFTQDRIDWDTLDNRQREAILWICNLFFTGEDEVTDTLSPFLKGLWTEEQRYVLTTQQVDEARHSVFFARFYDQVVNPGGDSSVIAHLQTASDQAFNQSGFGTIFKYLRHVVRELDRRPSRELLVKASTTYHLLVESTLAQPGQEFIQNYVCDGRLPGLRQGLERVAHDEHRHVAFGMRLLYDCIQEDEQAREWIFETLSYLLPSAIEVFEPPKMTYITDFGATQADIIGGGLRSLITKLNAMGISRDSIPSWVIPIELDSESVADDAVRIHEALHGKDSSVEAMERIVEAFARSLQPTAPLSLGMNIDGNRWHISAAPGLKTIVTQGAGGALVFRGSIDDLRSMAAGGAPMRVSGDMRILLPLLRSAPLARLGIERLIQSTQRDARRRIDHLVGRRSRALTTRARKLSHAGVQRLLEPSSRKEV